MHLPIAGKPRSFRPIPISNGDAYGLCQRFEQEGATGNSPAIVRIYLDIVLTYSSDDLNNVGPNEEIKITLWAQGMM